MNRSTLSKALAASLFALASLPALAQTNTFDISAGGGAADYFGSGSNSTHGMFEASAVYQFAPHGGLGFEYTYSPVATVDQNFAGFSVSGSAHLDHYGAVVRVPFGSRSHVEPYIAGRGGALHETASVTVTNIVTSSAAAYTGAYAGAGLGASLFLTHHLGVRPELRYEYLRVNGSHEQEMDFTASLFYRFGHRG